MSVILKKDSWKIKDPNTGEYRDSNVFSKSMTPKQAQEIVRYAENHIAEIATAVADMAELGTDTTLIISGMAADSKATGDAIAEINEVLDGREGIVITDLSGYTQHNGYPNNPGAATNWYIGTGKYKHIAVPVPAKGCILSMTAQAEHGMMYCGLKSYTVPETASSPVEYSDAADWTSRKTLPLNQSVTVSIPDDVNYLILVVIDNENNCYPTSFSLQKPATVGLVDRVNQIEKPLAGKKLFAFGDSITYGYITVDGVQHDVRYTETIREKLGCSIVNYGNSGAATGRLVYIVTGGTLDRRSAVDPSQPSVCTDYSDADIVTIMIGTNGGTGHAASGYSTFEDIPLVLGDTVKTIEDGGSIEYDGQTISTLSDYWDLFPNAYYSNVALCIEWIKWKKPEAKIYLIVPPENDIDGLTLDSFIRTKVRDAVYEIGNYYDVSVIDAQRNSQVNLHNLYDYTFDGIHFNEAGAAKWGEYVASQIKMLNP